MSSRTRSRGIRLPEKMQSWLEMYAKDCGCSFNKAVIKLLERQTLNYMDTLGEPMKELKREMLIEKIGKKLDYWNKQYKRWMKNHSYLQKFVEEMFGEELEGKTSEGRVPLQYLVNKPELELFLKIMSRRKQLGKQLKELLKIELKDQEILPEFKVWLDPKFRFGAKMRQLKQPVKLDPPPPRKCARKKQQTTVENEESFMEYVKQKQNA